MRKNWYQVHVCESNFVVHDDERSVARLLLIQCGDSCNLSHRAEIISRPKKTDGKGDKK